MQPIQNWNSIQASNGGSSLLAPGAYICKIVRVKDNTSEQKPYLAVVYDIFDTQSKTFIYQSETPDNDWRHQFKFYLGSEFGLKRYKALVEAVEGTPQNNGFRYDNNQQNAEQSLVGKWVAFVIRHRRYTNNKGEERTALDLAGSITTDDAQAGNYPTAWLDERDGSQQVQPAPQQEAPVEVYSEDIPF